MILEHFNLRVEIHNDDDKLHTLVTYTLTFARGHTLLPTNTATTYNE